MYSHQPEELVQLDGNVEGVSFRNPDNGFTVIDISVDGELITAVGVFADIGAGESITLFGTWDNHSLFGRQFKVEKYESKMPETSAQLLRYLSSGIIKGIGPKTAVKIIERFGENSFSVLESDPGRLSVIKGITKQKAQEISQEFNRQFSIRKVMMSLEEYGIKPMEGVEIFKHFGANAATIITENPYILCSTVAGFNFERAELIASRLPSVPQSRHRLRAGILYILKRNTYNGHTCLPREKIIEPCKLLLGISEDEAQSAIDETVEDKLIVSQPIFEREYLFLPDMFTAEKRAADRLILLSKFPAKTIDTLDRDIDEAEKNDNIKYETLQRLAIKTAAAKGMLILTGGPGTGKTTTVKGIISLFEHYRMNIVLAAPTGRAAKRMTELTGKEAKTIHRLLEVEWDKDDLPSFKRNMQNPIDADVVIVDELSMVDINVFSALLDALQFNCRLIMVGDCDQLPPVGAGNVLLDLVNSGMIPVVRLTEIFRQAQNSLIVMNAHKIISGSAPELDERGSDFFFLERNASLAAARTVTELCEARLPAAYGMNALSDIQVICPSRKGDCGTVNLNFRLQQALNPQSDEKNECRSMGRTFREGDKVMQIKNNYDLIWMKDSEEGCGVFNGDVGMIKKIDTKAGIMTIDFDERICEYSMDNLQELEHAYAVTVHKYQGSEAPAVIIPIIDAPPQLMYRNLLYTAVTRAKKLLILVGSRARIEEMVANNKKNRRYSALKYFITQED